MSGVDPFRPLFDPGRSRSLYGPDVEVTLRVGLNTKEGFQDSGGLRVPKSRYEVKGLRLFLEPWTFNLLVLRPLGLLFMICGGMGAKGKRLADPDG